jgi:uncharacterized protein YprB with RNaseH-like and TPR domain
MSEPKKRQERLRRLKRSIARGDFASARELLKGDLRPAVPAEAGVGQSPARLSLPDACPGHQQQIDTPHGEAAFWLVRRYLEQVDPDSISVQRQYVDVLRGARQRFDELEASAALCRVADGGPEDPLLLELETCRDDEAWVFLVGLMCFMDGRLVFEQCFARGPWEEEAVLQAFAGRYAGAAVLVTFGGERAGLGSVRRRWEACGFEEPWCEPVHLDLRAEARRRWRGRLRDFRLPVLERRVLGLRRTRHVAAPAVSEAYRRFIDTGDARGVRDILDRNALNLVTVAQLLCVLLTGAAEE